MFGGKTFGFFTDDRATFTLLDHLIGCFTVADEGASDVDAH
jgi:hypothetical protein